MQYIFTTQTDNRTWTTDILATDCKYDIVIPLVPDSDFIWDFGKLPFSTHLGKYIIKIGKIRAKIHEIGKIKAIFGLGMTPIYGLKNGQIKSLPEHVMSIFRHVYFAVIKLYTKRLKY